ncbi:MAG: hypothetical protein Fur005_18640 [Roseiflexaceae bacterium]
MSDLIGRTLGPYQILEQLGMGGMATVYKAFHPAMDRYVAIKVLPRHMAGDPQFRARFQREARTIAKLEHRSILPVYDTGEQDGVHYLVMRYTEAGDLRDWISQHKLSLEQGVLIVAQVAEALAYAHRQGVIHRDIKPANILLSSEGDALLSDFGIARIIEGSVQLTSDGMLIGTPHYMAPEQVQAQPSDARSDIYALGVVLYECVIGKRPFEAETPLAVALMHVHTPLPPPHLQQPTIPEDLERIILRATAKNPRDRYQSADELATALRRAHTQITGLPATAQIGAPETLIMREPDDLTVFDPLVAAQPVQPKEAAVAPAANKPKPKQSPILMAVVAGIAAISIVAAFVIFGRLETVAVEPVAPTPIDTSTNETPQAGVTPPNSLQSADGTPLNGTAITAIKQTEGDGVWIASHIGVARWDGDQGRLFTTNEGMPFDDTRALQPLPDGRLWIAGYESLALIKLDQDRIDIIDLFEKGDAPIEYVKSFLLDDDGSILAGGYLASGLMRHDGNEWHPLVPAIQEANLGDLSGEVNVLMRASSGDLWVASEVGLFRLTGGVWQRYGEDRGVGTLPVRGIVEAYGALWIASDKGLLRYDADNDRWQRIVIADDRAILTIGRMSNDSLMVGSWDELFESNDQGQTWQVVATIASGQLVDTPHVFIHDRAGRLWVGTATGLSRFDGQAWKKP